MQVVFLNSFEKAEAGAIVSAQCSICEASGEWTVIWVEGEQSAVWFEGGAWEDMMIAFRHGISVKMGEGFKPFIDGLLDARKAGAVSGGFIAMLGCYGELNANAQLYEELRQWRRQKAVSERKSAYLIANNRVLMMMAAFIPHSLEDLTFIPGWGELRQQAYSEEVLALTQGYEQPRPFPLDWVKDELDPKQFTRYIYKQSENKYRTLMERQRENRHIVNKLSAGTTVQQLQEELSIPRREVIDRLERLVNDGLECESLIDYELKSVPKKEAQLVMETMNEVGDRYLKPVFNRVYGSAEQLPEGLTTDTVYERLRLIRMKYRKKNASAG